MILCNLPPNEITSPLMRICTIQVVGLQKVLAGQQNSGSKSLPLYWLDRLTAIFRYRGYNSVIYLFALEFCSIMVPEMRRNIFIKNIFVWCYFKNHQPVK